MDHGRTRLHPVAQVVELVRQYAQTVHAGIEFQPQAERARDVGCFQQVNLPVRVDDRLQFRRRVGLEFIGIDETLQDRDALLDAAGAQGQALVRARHGEGIGFSQCSGDAQHAMPVGIGLDDSHDLGLGHDLAYAPQVTPGRVQIEDDVRGAGRVLSKFRRHRGHG